MDATFSDLIEASVRRLDSDRETNFAFLRQVPSTYAQKFVRYWEQAGDAAWAEYLRSDFPSRFWSGVPPRGFESFADRVGRQWDLLPNGAKVALGRMYVRRGAIPPYLRSPELTDKMLRDFADWQWPTERNILRALAKQFEVNPLDRQGGSEYRISEKRGLNRCETRLHISRELMLISYFHTLNDSSPFVLVDHSGDTVFPKNWDLISCDNLEKTVSVLNQIVAAFEQSVR